MAGRCAVPGGAVTDGAGTPLKRAALYLRVSTADQTVDNQRPDLERAAQARGLPVVVVYSENVSAAAKIRPQYQRMMQDARESAFEVLLVWALDRFGRSMTGNITDVLALNRLGVQLISVQEPWLDTGGPIRDLLLAIFSWVAEQERKRLSERIRAGHARAFAAGGPTGRAPFGLKNVNREVDGKMTVVDDGRREDAVRVGELFVETGSLRGAGQRLSAEGVAAPNGGTWSHVSVKAILTNRRLRGQVTYAGRAYARPDLVVWPPDLLRQIDSLLSRRRRVPAGAATPRHLSSSFVACAVCGGSLAASGSKKSGGCSYGCSKHNRHGRRACPGIGYRAEHHVDRALLDAVASLLDAEVVARAMRVLRSRLEQRARPAGRAAERERLKRAIAESDQRVRNYIKAIGNGEAPSPLLTALGDEQKRGEAHRAELVRIAVAPPTDLDAKRMLASIQRRLADLAELRQRPGIEARPILAALLQGRRLTATPIEIDGERRWQLTGRIPTGYLLSIVGKDTSADLRVDSDPSRLPRCRSAHRVGSFRDSRPSSFGRASNAERISRTFQCRFLRNHSAANVILGPRSTRFAARIAVRNDGVRHSAVTAFPTIGPVRTARPARLSGGLKQLLRTRGRRTLGAPQAHGDLEHCENDQRHDARICSRCGAGQALNAQLGGMAKERAVASRTAHGPARENAGHQPARQAAYPVYRKPVRAEPARNAILEHHTRVAGAPDHGADGEGRGGGHVAGGRGDCEQRRKQRGDCPDSGPVSDGSGAEPDRKGRRRGDVGCPLRNRDEPGDKAEDRADFARPTSVAPLNREPSERAARRSQLGRERGETAEIPMGHSHARVSA